MRQRPDTAELERLAEAILRNAPLPEDRKSLSYDQRMALKAQFIAAWDREDGAADMADEIRLFTALHGEETSGGDDDKARIAALNRSLAIDIRGGAWDEAPDRLMALLMEQTRARLRRVNPKYLKAREDPAAT